MSPETKGAPMSFETLSQLFWHGMETHRKRDALVYKSDGIWRQLSWEEILERVSRLALGFQDLGVRKQDRVVLLSENRVEWLLIDAALHVLGAVNVPIYATLPASQVSYIVQDSESTVVIASTPEQQEKLLQIRDEILHVKHFVAIDPPAGDRRDFLPLEVIESRGTEMAQGSQDPLRRLASETRPDDVATIIYTSGTTGPPKGVMLTHGNLVSNVKAALQVLPIDSTDIALSALPYSHVFERLVALYLYPAAGVSIAIAESVDKVAENLAEIRPTVMTFVPRLYEKMHARVLDTVSQSSFLRRRLFWWAISVGREHGQYRLRGERPPWLLDRMYDLATALVFKKLRHRVGGRMRFFISGGAPLAAEIAEFFWAAGITILEGYGLTETSPVIAVNRPERIKFGTVGPPIPGVEVKIAEDGEILSRGPHIMKGYYRNPAATREVLDADGWFHTGDVGFLDSDGFLTITDRKKDIIVTAGGKNIAPQPIENRLKSSPYIAEVVLVGNRRSFATALVVPNFGNLTAWTASQGVATRSRAELVQDPRVVAFMQNQIDEMTSDLAQFEKIKRIRLLADEFSIEGGELTPTLKVKRNIIETRYRDLIDELYLCGDEHLEGQI